MCVSIRLIFYATVSQFVRLSKELNNGRLKLRFKKLSMTIQCWLVCGSVSQTSLYHRQLLVSGLY